MDRELERAIESALQQEADGIEYYNEAAEKCSSAAGAHMFQSFVQDEERHLRWVKETARGMGVEVGDTPMPRERIKTIFAEARGELDDSARATQDEKDAISVALDMETKSFRNYKSAGRLAADEEAVALFERLAAEENQHYEMLQNTLEYLAANDQWFLWKEGALLTGDMSSLGQ